MTLSKIAVGVDFSPESQIAVDHAMMLAHRNGASLTLVHATTVPQPLSERSEDPYAALDRERLTARRAQLEELRTRLSGQGVDVSQVLVDGHADVRLAEAAHELGADLVAIGTHGRTGVRRVLLGSVAEKTTRFASSSVLVARGDAPIGGYREVVVGMDFSDLAWTALERALDMTARGANVKVVHAWHPQTLDYDLTGAMTIALRESAEAAVEENRERVASMASGKGVNIGLELQFGVPFVVLDGLSASAQLLVVGSHGRRGVRRFVLGSVAEATIRHAHCSVLVAR